MIADKNEWAVLISKNIRHIYVHFSRRDSYGFIFRIIKRNIFYFGFNVFDLVNHTFKIERNM